MTAQEAAALGYSVVRASVFEVGLVQDGVGLTTWWNNIFYGQMPELDNPLVMRAILANESYKQFMSIHITKVAEHLEDKWIKEEAQYRKQVDEAMRANSPWTSMMAMADGIKQCRIELQKAFGLTSEIKTADRSPATAVITYLLDGAEKKWSIGCIASETEEYLQHHLNKWIPNATFVSAKVVPDKVLISDAKQLDATDGGPTQ